MAPQETLTNEVVNGFNYGDPVPNWQDVGPSAWPGTSQFTDDNGQYWDAPVGFCWPTSFTGSITQSVSILMFGTRYPVGSGAVRTNNWSGQSASSGHGSLTNNNDVSQSR